MPGLTIFPEDPTNEIVEEVGELPSRSEVSDDSFYVLLQKLKKAHYGKTRRLSLEVESLRNQLAEIRGEGPAQLDSRSQALVPGGAPEYGGSPPLATKLWLDGAPESGGSAHSVPEAIGSQGARAEAPASRAPPRLPSARLSDASDLSRISEGNGSQGLSDSQQRQDIMREYVKRKDPLYRLVYSPTFDMAFSTVIVLFGCLSAFEAQFRGFDVALATGHASASTSSELVWPDGEAVLTALQWVFGVTFLVEMVLKMTGLRLAFWYDRWNWLDFAVNLLWVYSLLEITSVPVNPQIVHITRLTRLLRLVRIFRVFKSQQFDSLYLMTTAVKGSMSILAWTVVLLLLIHCILSIFLNQVLRETYFNIDDPAIAAGQVQVYEYFGTFFRSFLTMFEITLANWPPACRILIENVSEWFILYAVVHKMVLGFAVIGVVNGVFIQETFKVASLDDAVMVRQTMRRQAAHQDKMMRLFEEADLDGSGFIDAEEWTRVCEDDWVKLWLASQELNAGDAQSLFRLLDDGDGKLGAEELVAGVSRLRGAAATIELLTKIDRVIAKMDIIFAEGGSRVSR